MSEKINQEIIILRFMQTHGEKYNYDKVLFSRMKSKVEIIFTIKTLSNLSQAL